MRSCRAALILSFICPGLGQIYRREILKGISFIMICALLVVSLFFLLPPPPFLYFSGLSILLLMWLVGMVDAYIDDEFLMGRERWLIWQKLLSILPVALISAAVVALIMLWMHDFSAMNERLVASARLKTPPGIHSLTGSTTESFQLSVISPGNSEFYSIQVASFRDLERAEKAYWDLRYRGYTVAIEQSISGAEIWHRVLVGRFSSEQDATAFTEILHEREGFSGMVVHRRSSEKKPTNLP